MVVSFDGVNKEALDYAKDGKISCIAECNPLHGPRVRALVDTLIAGETPDKFNYVDERLFSAIPNVESITVEGRTYEVQNIGE
jgi:simple sugar transport system substrate-binding protein